MWSARLLAAGGLLAELEAAFDRRGRSAAAAKGREGLAAAMVRCTAGQFGAAMRGAACVVNLHGLCFFAVVRTGVQE
jgi:hypothetical protein